jgi:hypothetical protein
MMLISEFSEQPGDAGLSPFKNTGVSALPKESGV